MKKQYFIALASFLFLTLLMAGENPEIQQDKINVLYFPELLILEAEQPAMGLSIKIAGPDGFYNRTVYPGNSATVDLLDSNGQLLPDGLYQYEARLVPQQLTGLKQTVQPQLNKDRQLSKYSLTNGSFRIIYGQIASPNSYEDETSAIREDRQ